ncbi:DNA repair protein RecO [Aquamicrobium segne]|uniref:DNA repair protein RecO n=1 Tax=Aquamicrobium segne TaxID=469547 RepID=A0ABW0H126_9HYPH
MEWKDEGIILGTRKHGETSAILEVMTRAHGRHLGLVRGGRSRRLQPMLQPGNRVELIWRARLDEHLGTFQAEALEMNAARLMDSAIAIYGLQLLAAHVRLLPERDVHHGLYETLLVMIAHLDDPDAAGELLARFELLVLEELGYGLDFSQCAATGQRDDLVYVSPKSGRAVSRAAGLPWHDKMLALPAFLEQEVGGRADISGLEEAFCLSAFFLNRHVYEPRGLEPPDARAGFLTALRRHFSSASCD